MLNEEDLRWRFVTIFEFMERDSDSPAHRTLQEPKIAKKPLLLNRVSLRKVQVKVLIMRSHRWSLLVTFGHKRVGIAPYKKSRLSTKRDFLVRDHLRIADS